jgi:hypothetical protein
MNEHHLAATRRNNLRRSVLRQRAELVKLFFIRKRLRFAGHGNYFMTIQEQIGVRSLESEEDFFETRLEAIGFIFHGVLPIAKSKGAGSAASNLLHFARCPKLERISDREIKIWFRSVRLAHKHLDEVVGAKRWKWCKLCEREITQRVLDES